MDSFEAIIKLSENDIIAAGADIPKIHLHKWLTLGQTEYLCRYGTLSDGHEKFTDAQKYAQALKEYYYISVNMKQARAQAKIAQADYLDAKEALEKATTDAQKLRAEGQLEQAESRLTTSLVSMEDQFRMIKAYAQVCAELGPKVQEQYPMGIEQAEMDNWVAVAKYRQIAQGPAARMDNIPLPPEVKAEIGIQYQRNDMVAPLMIEKENEIRSLPSGSVNEYLGLEVSQ